MLDFDFIWVALPIAIGFPTADAIDNKDFFTNKYGGISLIKRLKTTTNFIFSLGLYPMDHGKTLHGSPVHGKSLYNGHLRVFSVHHPPLSIHRTQIETYWLFFSNLAYEIILDMQLLLD